MYRFVTFMYRRQKYLKQMVTSLNTPYRTSVCITTGSRYFRYGYLVSAYSRPNSWDITLRTNSSHSPVLKPTLVPCLRLVLNNSHPRLLARRYNITSCPSVWILLNGVPRTVTRRRAQCPWRMGLYKKMSAVALPAVHAVRTQTSTRAPKSMLIETSGRTQRRHH